MTHHLRHEEYQVGRKRIRRLMRLMDLGAIYQKTYTSRSYPQHRLSPYLLRGLQADRPGQVWTVEVSATSPVA